MNNYAYVAYTDAEALLYNIVVISYPLPDITNSYHFKMDLIHILYGSSMFLYMWNTCYKNRL